MIENIAGEGKESLTRRETAWKNLLDTMSANIKEELRLQDEGGILSS